MVKLEWSATFPKKFKPFQLHYSVTEKESLALVFWPPNIWMCMLVQAVLLWCVQITLTFLQSLPNPHQHLMRWALFLQPHQLDVQHIRGTAKDGG